MGFCLISVQILMVQFFALISNLFCRCNWDQDCMTDKYAVTTDLVWNTSKGSIRIIYRYSYSLRLFFLYCFYAEDGVPRSSRSMSLTVGKVFLQYKENERDVLCSEISLSIYAHFDRLCSKHSAGKFSVLFR